MFDSNWKIISSSEDQITKDTSYIIKNEHDNKLVITKKELEFWNNFGIKPRNVKKLEDDRSFWFKLGFTSSLILILVYFYLFNTGVLN